MTVDRFFGTWEGTGSWHEADGKSASYRVRQTMRAITDGFEVAFHHDFDDRSVVEARFAMTWITGELFRVAIAGETVGDGYLFGTYCHYYLKKAHAYIEVGYRLGGDTLEVFGSSSTNAAGNYIAWQELLRRS